MAVTDPSARPDTPDLTPRSRWVGARMTLDEFLALPEEKPYLEWDRGVVLQKDVPFVLESLPRNEARALMVKEGDQYRVVTLNYHGGLRYPHLERTRGPDRIGAILSAR